MSYTEIGNQKIINCLLAERTGLARMLYQTYEGDDNQPELLDKIFGIDGLTKTIITTVHLASWQLRVIDESDTKGDIRAHISFKLTTGSQEDPTSIFFSPKGTFFTDSQEQSFSIDKGGDELVREDLNRVKAMVKTDGKIIFTFTENRRSGHLRRVAIDPSSGKIETQRWGDTPSRQTAPDPQQVLF